MAVEGPKGHFFGIHIMIVFPKMGGGLHGLGSLQRAQAPQFLMSGKKRQIRCLQNGNFEKSQWSVCLYWGWRGTVPNKNEVSQVTLLPNPPKDGFRICKWFFSFESISRHTAHLWGYTQAYTIISLGLVLFSFVLSFHSTTTKKKNETTKDQRGVVEVRWGIEWIIGFVWSQYISIRPRIGTSFQSFLILGSTKS